MGAQIAVVVRKAYGGGHYAMGGRPTKPDFLVAWPSAELGFMAPETGINTVFRHRLEKAFEEGGAALADEVRAELTTDWQDESRPWEAAAHFYLDDIIDPSETRSSCAPRHRAVMGSRGTSQLGQPSMPRSSRRRRSRTLLSSEP